MQINESLAYQKLEGLCFFHTNLNHPTSRIFKDHDDAAISGSESFPHHVISMRCYVLFYCAIKSPENTVINLTNFTPPPIGSPIAPEETGCSSPSWLRLANGADDGQRWWSIVSSVILKAFSCSLDVGVATTKEGTYIL